MTNMKLDCSVKVDIKADYCLVEPKELEQALREYTEYGTSKHFSMSEDKLMLKFSITERIVFDSFADMTLNLEKRILEVLDNHLKCANNWNVLYHITRIEGYDSWG